MKPIQIIRSAANKYIRVVQGKFCYKIHSKETDMQLIMLDIDRFYRILRNEMPNWNAGAREIVMELVEEAMNKTLLDTEEGI